MSFGLCFWILMLLLFVFFLWLGWPNKANYKANAVNLILFLLLLLLGWAEFGAPLHK